MLPSSIVESCREDLLEIVLKNGSVIALKGAKDPDVRRGPALDRLALDEIQDFAPEDFETIFRPLLTGKYGRAILAGTKKYKNWFVYDWLKVEKGLIPQSQAFWFPATSNPTIDPQEWVMIQESLKSKGKEKIWDFEYIGDPHKDEKEEENLKFTEFTRIIHCVSSFIIPDSWKRYRAIDWGQNHPTVCLWAARSPKGVIYIYDELKVRNMSVEQVSRNIHMKTGPAKIEATILDPACWNSESDKSSAALRFNQCGVHVVRGERENKAMSGANLLKDYFKPVDNQPKIFIFSHCNELMDELDTITWEKSIEDDATDALRYLIVFVNRIPLDMKLEDKSWYDSNIVRKLPNGKFETILPKYQHEPYKFSGSGDILNA